MSEGGKARENRAIGAKSLPRRSVVRPGSMGSVAVLPRSAHLHVGEEGAASNHLLLEQRDAVVSVERGEEPNHHLVTAAREALVRHDRLRGGRSVGRGPGLSG